MVTEDQLKALETEEIKFLLLVWKKEGIYLFGDFTGGKARDVSEYDGGNYFVRMDTVYCVSSIGKKYHDDIDMYFVNSPEEAIRKIKLMESLE